PIVVALRGTPRDTGLNLDLLLKLDEYFESIAPKYRDFLARTKMSVIDTGVLWHQIPGGMFTNMVAQLREADALHRLPEVYAELPQTRRELGYPPLVTPTSQIVGTQAINNVLFGRYKVISQQVKDYVYGLYGKSPASIDPRVQELVLKGYEKGERPITCRAADVLEPELDKAKEATKDIARDIGDVLAYALYPTTGMRFLRWKYGLEEPPPETKAKTLKDIKREDELIAKAKAGEFVEVGLAAPPPVAEAPAKIEEEKEVVAGTPLLAPMPGTIIRYLVNEGDEVKAGDDIVVLEAMKMENVLPTPEDGEIKAINFKPGDRVNANDVLAIIG
ncbi:unnamed protein product, partial [marine sediment metagenome]